MQPSDVELTSEWPKKGLSRGKLVLSCQAAQIKTQNDAGLRLMTMMVQGLAAGFSFFGDGWFRVAEFSCYATSAIGSLLILLTYKSDLFAFQSVVMSALRDDPKSVIKQTFLQSEKVHRANDVYQRPLRFFANFLHIAGLAMTLVKCFPKA